MALLIEGLSGRKNVLLELMHAKMKQNLSAAKEGVPSIENLANTKAKQDLTKEIALSIKDACYRESALLDIVKVEAQCNLGRAKKTARLIKNLYWRGLAFFEIVKVEAQQIFNGAKETALSIEEPYWRGRALIEIIRIGLVRGFISRPPLNKEMFAQNKLRRIAPLLDSLEPPFMDSIGEENLTLPRLSSKPKKLSCTEDKPFKKRPTPSL